MILAKILYKLPDSGCAFWQASLPGRTDIGRGNRYEHADIYAGARIPVRIAEVRCTEQSAAYTFGAASLAGSMRVCAITTLSAASFPGTLLATCQILSGMLGKNRNSPEIPDAGTAA